MMARLLFRSINRRQHHRQPQLNRCRWKDAFAYTTATAATTSCTIVWLLHLSRQVMSLTWKQPTLRHQRTPALYHQMMPSSSTDGQNPNNDLSHTLMVRAEEEVTDTVVLNDFIGNHQLCVYHLKRSVESTQDEAKRLIQKAGACCSEHQTPPHLAVIADFQSNGRGTSGRTWIASPGNLYLTYCLPMDDVPVSKLTLVPLSIGVLVAEELQSHMDECCSSLITVKWPNDILLDGKKVAGTLIENCASNHHNNHKYWLLIGVGVNLASHPQHLPPEKQAQKPARRAGSLSEYIMTATTAVPSAMAFGVNLSKRIRQLVVQGDLGHSVPTTTRSEPPDEYLSLTHDRSSIIRRWRSFSRMGETYTIRQTGETVTTLDVEQDGRLRVIGTDGTERLLVSDYFV
jgi:biotin-[acetyl-CoA-carboxylase] ligase BirA-like protein